MGRFTIPHPTWKHNEDNGNRKIDKAKKYPIEKMYEGKLRRTGKTLMGICELHEEKNASFAIYTDNNTWHCFAEGVGGDSINYYMRKTGCTFIKALEELTK